MATYEGAMGSKDLSSTAEKSSAHSQQGDSELKADSYSKTSLPIDNEKDLEHTKEQPSDLSDDDDDYPKSFRLVAIVVALILSVFLVSLDMTIVATAIPRITDQFHSLNDVGYYGSAFFLTLAAFQSMWGKAYKYFPLKPSFLLSILIFEVGSLICAVAKDSKTLIVGRAIAGLGGAGIASGAYTIIAFSAKPERRPAFTGILGAVYGCASVIGPLLGGVFTDRLSWRWCFYINLPIGGVAAFIIFFTFRTPSRFKPVEATLREKIIQMDLPGSFTIMACVICYLLALQWGGITKSWNSSPVIGTLVGFVLFAILFVVIQYFMGERALLPGRLLKMRVIYMGCIYIVFLGGIFFTLLYYLPIYFQTVDGVSPSQSGIRNIPLVVGCSLFTIISGGLITVYGHYVPLAVLGSAIAITGAGLIYSLDIGSPSSHWIGYQVIAGIGLGLGFQIPIIVAQASVDPVDISAVTAMVLFFQVIGGSFFVSAGQAAFANRLLSTLAKNAPSVNPGRVIATGATQLREVFTADQIPGILLSYLDGLHIVFAIGIATGAVSLIASIFMPFRKIDAKAAMKGA